MLEFHFIRPWCLLGFLPATVLGWRLWATEDAGRSWRKIVAPHLLPHLLTGRDEQSWFNPLNALLFAWAFAVLALSGPTWEREPAPFSEDSAVLAIVLKVTPSMESRDVQPTRLARATEKIRDLLKLRPGAKTAFFVYAGTTHRVMPLTTDGGIINSFASDLAPDVLPVEGAAAGAALAAADETVKHSGQAGWVLWIADSASKEEIESLRKYQADDRTPVRVLAVASDGAEKESLKQAASAIDAQLVSVAPDDSDVDELMRNVRLSALSEQSGGDRWKDFGYWLVPPLAILTLVWYRRGWMVRSIVG